MSEKLIMPDYVVLVDDKRDTCTAFVQALDDLSWIARVNTAMESASWESTAEHQAAKRLRSMRVTLRSELLELASDPSCLSSLASMGRQICSGIVDKDGFRSTKEAIESLDGQRGVIWMDFDLTATMSGPDRQQVYTDCRNDVRLRQLAERRPHMADVLEQALGGVSMTLAYAPSLLKMHLMVIASSGCPQPFEPELAQSRAVVGGSWSIRFTSEADDLGKLYAAVIVGLNFWFASQDWMTPWKTATAGSWFVEDEEWEEKRFLPHSFAAAASKQSEYIQIAQVALPWLPTKWVNRFVHEAMKGLFGARSLLGASGDPKPLTVGSVLLAAVHACYVENNRDNIDRILESLDEFWCDEFAGRPWLDPIPDPEAGERLVRCLVEFFRRALNPDDTHLDTRVDSVSTTMNGVQIYISWASKDAIRNIRANLISLIDDTSARVGMCSAALNRLVQSAVVARNDIGWSGAFRIKPGEIAGGIIEILGE